MEDRPLHSPLGASGAERWQECHGSVGLLKLLQLDESDEADWTREGTAMHEAAAYALRDGLEAWELNGLTFHDTPITDALSAPLLTYLGYCRAIGGTTQWIEYGISSPIHPMFYGACDFGSLSPGDDGRSVLNVVDLKGGEGIPVEVDDNPQLKYYAFGLIDGLERQRSYVFDDAMVVRLAIVQPRITWHPAGPIRTWDTTVGEIKAWVHDVLVPHMNATQFDDSLKAGPWCRFCPAKLVCPLLTAMFGAAAKANPKHVEQMTPARLGLEYEASKAVKFYITALEKHALAVLMRGEDVPLIQLERKRANRAWKPGSPELAMQRYGQAAFSKPELLTPAALEAAVPAAKEWIKQMAYTPDTGFTVGLRSGGGHAVKATPVAERFATSLEAIKEAAE